MFSPTTKAVIQSARPPFLLLTPSCIALGAACANYSGANVAAFDLVVALIGGIAAHVSVNTFNEYFDYVSGLDAQTQRTPFSGGSGSLIATPSALQYVLTCAWASLALAFAVGTYFLITAGPAIVPLGLVGAAIIYAYTGWINKNPWACLLAPGLGFGPLMVVGTQAALTGQITPLCVWVSLVPMFLVSNLLLVNQLPDIEPDQQVGRRHLAISHGIPAAINAYLVLLLGALVTIMTALVTGMLPLLSGLSVIPIGLGFLVYSRLSGFLDNDGNLPLQAMAINVVVAVATPFLLAITLLV